jgi:hypothetical protein
MLEGTILPPGRDSETLNRVQVQTEMKKEKKAFVLIVTLDVMISYFLCVDRLTSNDFLGLIHKTYPYSTQT